MAKKTIQVVYKVDNKELLQTQKVIDGIEKEAKQADDAVKKFGADAKKAGNDATGGMMNLKNVMNGIAALGFGAVLASIAKKTFDLGVKQEQLNIAFEVFLGSAAKAKKLLGELNQFANITPFSPDQVNNAAKSLLAFGVAGDEIIPTLKFLGDVSAGTGKDLSEMAIIFGQIRSTGRLMGQDLLQLINAGFNPLQQISEKTGKSVGVLKEEMEKGLVSFDMVKQAFIDATSAGGTFFNLMEKQSQSVGGILSTVEGNIDGILKNLFTATSGPVKAFVDQLLTLSEAFLHLSESSEQSQDRMQQQKISAFVDDFKAFASAFKDVNAAAKINIQTIDEEIAALKKRNDEIYNGAEAKEGEYRANFDAIDSKKLEKQAILEYADSLNKTVTPAVKALTEEEKKRLKVLNDLASKYAESLARMADEELINKYKLGDKAVKALEEQFLVKSDYIEQEQEKEEGLTDAEIAEYKKRTDARKRHAEEVKQIEKIALDFALNAIYAIATAKDNSTQNEISALQASTEEQIKLAGDNERAKDQIKAQSKIKEDALKKRQIEEDKRNTVKRILIEGALNAVKALGLPPIPGANFIAAAFALGQAGIQAAAVRGFKDGEVNINGKGTATSDSIPAMLSRGESVINARATARSSNLLEAINDRRIDDRVLRNGSLGNRGAVSFNDSRIVSAIENNKVDYVRHGTVLMEVKESKNKFKLYMRSKNQGY